MKVFIYITILLSLFNNYYSFQTISKSLLNSRKSINNNIYNNNIILQDVINYNAVQEKSLPISILSLIIKKLKLVEICEAIDNTGTLALVYFSVASVLIPIAALFLFAIEGAQAMLDKSSPRQFDYEHIIPKYFAHSKRKMAISILFLPFLCVYESINLMRMLLIVEWDAIKTYPNKIYNMIKKDRAKIFAWLVLTGCALAFAISFFAAWCWIAMRFGWEQPFILSQTV